MKNLINPQNSVLALMILSSGAWRLFFSSGHSPIGNFTPIGAMALFGGCYFADKWKAFLVPILTLWLSDLLLSYFIYFHEWKLFYDGFYITYASFAFMVLMGRFIRKINVKNIFLMSVLAALTHWIITDFGVWLDGRLYPLTFEGFVACYVAALPYLQNMLIANLVFGAVMFGAFEIAKKRFPVLSMPE